jgi:hypothetical protein
MSSPNTLLGFPCAVLIGGRISKRSIPFGNYFFWRPVALGDCFVGTSLMPTKPQCRIQPRRREKALPTPLAVGASASHNRWLEEIGQSYATQQHGARRVRVEPGKP